MSQHRDLSSNSPSEKFQTTATPDVESIGSSGPRARRNFLARRWVQIGFFSLCMGFLIAFGLLSIGRSESLESQYDIRFCYTAGQAWLAGENAYETKGFANPPPIAPLCTFLGVFPWSIARVIMMTLNVFCLGALVYFCLRLLRETEGGSLRLKGSGAEWYIAGIIAGNPFTAKTVWMGQTSIIVGAALVGSWYFYRRGLWVGSGVLLAIASIKPQLSILVVLWYLLDQRWRILGAAAGAFVLLCLIPLVVNGPFDLWLDWFSALAAYKQLPENSLGWIGQAGLQNALYLLTGIEVPLLFPVAIAIILGLWVWRSRFLPNDIFGILPLLSLLLGYGHYHDVVALSLLIPLFWRHLREQPKAKLVTGGLLAALAATFSHAAFNPPYEVFKMMLGFRAFILLALGFVLLEMSARKVKSYRRRGLLEGDCDSLLNR